MLHTEYQKIKQEKTV